jgi:hypothetical protein
MEFYPGAFLGTVELSPFFLVNLRECIPARQPTRSLGDLQEKPPRTRERLMRAPWRPGLPARSVPTTRNEEPTDSHSSKGGYLGLATLRRRSRGRFQGPGFRPAFAGGVGVAFTAPAFARPLPTAPFFRMPWGMAGPGRPAPLVGSGSPPPQPTTLARPRVRPAIPLRRDDLQRIHTP